MRRTDIGDQPLTPTRGSLRINAFAGSKPLIGGKGTMRLRTIFLFMAVAVAGATPWFAQSPAEKPDAPKPAAASSTKKPVSFDSNRVSTEQALADAAREKATKKDAKEEAQTGDAVLEFHPITPSAAPRSSAATSKDSRKSPLKDIHGEAYGLAGGGGNMEGGKAGGSSKNGKTNIYVETNHSGSSPSK
jgi:hypothetical protein